KKETARREAVDEHLVQINYGKLAKLRNLRYSVTVFEQNFLNREKEVDSEVSLRISNTIHDYMPSTVILITGDGDYGPIFRRVLDKNWTIEIWFWTD
ncbi:11890_t:CDS:2, partial [Funneliformis caledonium]